MQTITTKYSNKNLMGTGQIVAKGAGRQRTVNYNHAKSSEWNHGVAAGTLAVVLGLKWSDGITHMGFNDGTHKFNFPS